MSINTEQEKRFNQLTADLVTKLQTENARILFPPRVYPEADVRFPVITGAASRRLFLDRRGNWFISFGWEGEDEVVGSMEDILGAYAVVRGLEEFKQYKVGINPNIYTNETPLMKRYAEEVDVAQRSLIQEKMSQLYPGFISALEQANQKLGEKVRI